MGTDVFTGQYFFDWGKILIQVCGLYFQITNIFVMLTHEITFPLVMISEPICHLLTLNLKKGMLYCWLGMDLQALRILPCVVHQKPLVLAIPWVPLTASRSFDLHPCPSKYTINRPPWLQLFHRDIWAITVRFTCSLVLMPIENLLP